MTIPMFITFFALMLIGVPLAYCLAGSALMAFAFFSDTDAIVVAQRFFTGSDSFTLLAIPFFMISGSLMARGGVSKRLINLCNLALRRVPGGLAMVTIVACAFFGAISGSAPATCAAIGGIMIPAMIESGYDKKFAMMTAASGGFLGHIIPPSISMVTYGVASGVSIGDMFMAGFLPGILMAGCMCIYAGWVGYRNDYRVRITGGTDADKPFPKRIFSVLWVIIEAIPAILMPVIILGGIYGGVFTPTEAGCVAVVYGLLVGMFVYRELKLKDIPDLLKQSALSTSLVVLIVAAASSFGNILTREMIPTKIAEFIMGISDNKIIFLLLINVLLLIVGCFMDTQVSIIILAPILLPAAEQMGVDPLHFGIIMVCNLAVGLITPPLGLNLNVASSIGKVTLTEILGKHCLMYLVVDVIALMIITYVDKIGLWLPSLMQ